MLSRPLGSSVLALATALTLTACGGKGGGGTTPEAQSGPVDLLTVVPESATAVLGVNAKDVVDSKLWKLIYPVLQKEDEFAKAENILRDSCGIDALRDVESVMLAIPASADDSDLLVYVRGNFDEAKLSACAAKFAQQEGAVLTAKVEGKLSVWSVTGESKQAYLGWADAHTLVFQPRAFTEGDPSGLIDALSGQASVKNNAPLMEQLAKVDRSQTAWGAFVKPSTGPLAESAEMPLAIWGHAHHVDDLTGTLNVKMPSAEAAQQMVDQGKAGLGQVPFDLSGLKLEAQGDVIVVNLEFTPAALDDLLGAISPFLQSM